ncbi:urease accessory protein UreF [Frateuria aurantia]
MNMPTADTRAALLQLASATLPVGAFSHSLGMEAALEAGQLGDAEQAETWIADYLEWIWAPGEAVYWLALQAAWSARDGAQIVDLNQQIVATRETAELRLESEQTGRSLRQWLLALPQAPRLGPWQREQLIQLEPVSWVSVHACASVSLGIDTEDALHALGWSLLENLVAAAVRLVPLGQIAGQAILRRQALRLPALIRQAEAIPVADARNFAPMLGLLSARHETQYTRLFRS